ncbi:hypothetical protein ACFYTS_19895 [Nocardia sp. NPDC004151]|uniref:hypothetical protein n=1 Tax=Nocardia sp. NPDC004151 TaxID=3364304 RepID=UPI0036AE1CE0
MSAGYPIARGIGRSAVVLMATGALAGLGTSTASASEVAVTLNVPAGGYVVGTEVWIDLKVSPTLFHLPWERVTLRDNGTCFFSGFQGFMTGFYTTWIPTTAGSHTITVTQGPQSASQTVAVAAAPPGTPTPNPGTYGCDGAGSVGTGSFGTGSFGL